MYVKSVELKVLPLTWCSSLKKRRAALRRNWNARKSELRQVTIIEACRSISRLCEAPLRIESLRAFPLGVSLKVEYVTPTKMTRDVESLLFGHIEDNYSTIGPCSLLAVDFEAGGWRGNCAAISLSAG
ncbi:hypothetical protein TNCV_3837391 [Trichonephila clavipes]|nr:hypothetical protein TNCV_3837391 [Trichonephila clavipes]